MHFDALSLLQYYSSGEQASMTSIQSLPPAHTLSQESAYFPTARPSRRHSQDEGNPSPTSQNLFRFPLTTGVLWDHTPKGPSFELHPTCSRNIALHVSEAALRLAHRHALQAQTRPYVGFLVGTVTVDAGEEGLTVALDRFDPGRDVPGRVFRLPTAKLPGDFLVPLTLLLGEADISATHTSDDFVAAFKFLDSSCSSHGSVDPARSLVLRVLCRCLSAEDDITFSLHFGAVVMATAFDAFPVRPVPIIPTALARNLMGPLSLSEVQGTCKTGFLTMDETRKLLMLLESDPKASTLPLIGIWLSGVTHQSNPMIWSACLRYVNSTSIQERVYSPSGGFLVILFTRTSPQPVFYECLVKGEQAPRFMLIGCRENLHVFKHASAKGKPLVQMELTPARSGPSKSLFLQTLSRLPPPQRTSSQGQPVGQRRGSSSSSSSSRRRRGGSLTSTTSAPATEELQPIPRPSPKPILDKSPSVMPSVPELSFFSDSFSEPTDFVRTGQPGQIQQHAIPAQGDPRSRQPSIGHRETRGRPAPRKQTSLQRHRLDGSSSSPTQGTVQKEFILREGIGNKLSRPDRHQSSNRSERPGPLKDLNGQETDISRRKGVTMTREAPRHHPGKSVNSMRSSSVSPKSVSGEGPIGSGRRRSSVSSVHSAPSRHTRCESDPKCPQGTRGTASHKQHHGQELTPYLQDTRQNSHRHSGRKEHLPKGLPSPHEHPPEQTELNNGHQCNQPDPSEMHHHSSSGGLQSARLHSSSSSGVCTSCDVTGTPTSHTHSGDSHHIPAPESIEAEGRRYVRQTEEAPGVDERTLEHLRRQEEMIQQLQDQIQLLLKAHLPQSPGALPSGLMTPPATPQHPQRAASGTIPNPSLKDSSAGSSRDVSPTQPHSLGSHGTVHDTRGTHYQPYAQEGHRAESLPLGLALPAAQGSTTPPQGTPSSGVDNQALHCRPTDQRVNGQEALQTSSTHPPGSAHVTRSMAVNTGQSLFWSHIPQDLQSTGASTPQESGPDAHPPTRPSRTVPPPAQLQASASPSTPVCVAQGVPSIHDRCQCPGSVEREGSGNVQQTREEGGPFREEVDMASDPASTTSPSHLQTGLRQSARSSPERSADDSSTVFGADLSSPTLGESASTYAPPRPPSGSSSSQEESSEEEEEEEEDGNSRDGREEGGAGGGEGGEMRRNAASPSLLYRDEKKFYDNLLGQVQQLLHPANGSDSQDNGEEVRAEDDEEDGSTDLPRALPDISAATLGELEKLGIHLHGSDFSIDERSLYRSLYNASPELHPHINYVSLADFTFDPCDLSMEANAIAMKYLSDGELAKLSAGFQAGEKTPGKTGRGRVGVNPLLRSALTGTREESLCVGAAGVNMSLASRRYMEKYGLLGAADDTGAARGTASPPWKPESQLNQSPRTGRLLTAPAVAKTQSSHHPDATQHRTAAKRKPVKLSFTPPKEMERPTSGLNMEGRQMDAMKSEKTTLGQEKQKVLGHLKAKLSGEDIAGGKGVVGESTRDNILDISKLKQLPKLL